jgi:hypothetical protein
MGSYLVGFKGNGSSIKLNVALVVGILSVCGDADTVPFVSLYLCMPIHDEVAPDRPFVCAAPA